MSIVLESLEDRINEDLGSFIRLGDVVRQEATARTGLVVGCAADSGYDSGISYSDGTSIPAEIVARRVAVYRCVDYLPHSESIKHDAKHVFWVAGDEEFSVVSRRMGSVVDDVMRFLLERDLFDEDRLQELEDAEEEE
jgi:hypothetical protein